MLFITAKRIPTGINIWWWMCLHRE